MKRDKFLKYTFALLAFVATMALHAQWPSHHSVLSENNWYKIGVTTDGVYGLDYATLQSLGIDVQRLNPSKIRMFGNA